MNLSHPNNLSILPTSSLLLLVGLWFRVLAVWMLVVWIPNALSAQKINTIRYTVEDGLPSSNIYQSIEDDKGFIWIVTDKGIAKFDGYTFQNFTIQDGLPSNDVWGIKKDNAGRLWLSTFNKLTYIQNNQIHTIALQDTSLFKAPMIQEYWVGEADEIYVLVSENNINHFLHIDMQEGIQTVVKKKFEYTGYLGYKNDRKWFFNFPRKGTPFISYIEEDSTKEQIQLYLNLSPSTVVNRKFVKLKERIYFFTKDAIWYFYYNGIEKVPVERLFGEKVIIEDVFPSNTANQNLFLLKTNKGFQILNEQLEVLPLLTKSDNFYKGILGDRDGNIWLTATNGLFFITANAQYSKYYPLSTNYTNNNCTAVFVEEDHTIWAANQQNQIWKISQNQIQHWQLSQKDYTHLPLKHLLKWENYLVAAGDFGIFFLSPASFQQTKITAQSFNKINKIPIIYDIKKGNFLPSRVKSISRDKEGLLLSKWNGVFKAFKQGDHLYHNNFMHGRTYVSEQDVSGKIWLGRKDGLWSYDQGQLIQMGKKHRLLQHPINDLKIDHHGNIWIATDGFGLLLFDGEQVFEIEESKNSISNRLYIDEDEQIWTATNRGISKINLASTHPSLSYRYTLITTAHGLISNEVNSIVVKDSLIYAATNAGLTIIDHTRQLNTNPPTLYIQQITANGKKIDSDDHYEGSYQDNNIRLEYVSLSYQSRGNISYEYKMSSIDQDWQTTTSTIREYPQLLPGNYEFIIRARDINNNYSEEKKVKLTINAPWWKTLWFRFLSGISLIGLVLGIIQWRVSLIRRQEEEKTRINQQFAELELRALRAQMNPHFIFNSMNAIQNFVYTKDKREAGKYIVQFSRLMRLFLNASADKFISLKQEFEILERYVELEQLRFENKFDYEFITDKTLPLTSIQIPSLILQPYVENAINHGLVHRTSKGRLWVRVKRGKGNTFICEVEDNGIGRVAAQKIRAKSVKKHRSRGMAIVTERQQLLNNKTNLGIQIEILDLYDADGQASGTKVVVQMPVG